MIEGFSSAAWLGLENQFHWNVLSATFLICAVWETLRPRRTLVAPAGPRWLHHSALAFLVNSPLMWIYPVTAVMTASSASGNSHGVLNQSFLPAWLKYAAAILLLDLTRYAQHRLYHAIPLLWRIHRVHHADPDCDWSTGLVFHPFEVALTQASYLGMIVILAPPPLAVMGLELVTVAQNFLEHANVGLPPWIETGVRRLVVTSDMHRIHHSEEPADQNANFGTVFPWWDRIFRTYISESVNGSDKMDIGLRELADKRGLSVLGLVALPFRRLETARTEPVTPVRAGERT